MRPESLVRPSRIRLSTPAALLMAAAFGCSPTGGPTNDTTPATDSGTPGPTGQDSGLPEGTDAGVDAGPVATTDGGETDAGWVDAGWPDSGPTGNGCGGYTPVALTVKNALVWCTVSVAGGTPSAAAEQTVCVGEGPTVTLQATANPGFVLGDWHGTTGDTGAGDPGTITGSGTSAETTATVDATGHSVCVWICCPGASGYEPCPTANQCP